MAIWPSIEYVNSASETANKNSHHGRIGRIIMRYLIMTTAGGLRTNTIILEELISGGNVDVSTHEPLRVVLKTS